MKINNILENKVKINEIIKSSKNKIELIAKLRKIANNINISHNQVIIEINRTVFTVNLKTKIVENVSIRDNNFDYNRKYIFSK